MSGDWTELRVGEDSSQLVEQFRRRNEGVLAFADRDEDLSRQTIPADRRDQGVCIENNSHCLAARTASSTIFLGSF